MWIEPDESHPNSLYYVVEQKAEGKFRLARTLLICGYVLFAALFFFVCYITAFIPLCALLPLWCWMLTYFTFYRTSPSYIITLQSGQLSVYRRLRKNDTWMFTAPLASAIEISAFAPDSELPTNCILRDWRGTVKHTPSCLLIFPGVGQAQDTAVLLPVTQKMLRQFRLYNRDRTLLREQEAGV